MRPMVQQFLEALFTTQLEEHELVMLYDYTRKPIAGGELNFNTFTFEFSNEGGELMVAFYEVIPSDFPEVKMRRDAFIEVLNAQYKKLMAKAVEG